MDKHNAIALLGGSPSQAAAMIGISAAAVAQWPAVLPPRIADRVQAALWRKHQAELGVKLLAEQAVDSKQTQPASAVMFGGEVSPPPRPAEELADGAVHVRTVVAPDGQDESSQTEAGAF